MQKDWILYVLGGNSGIMEFDEQTENKPRIPFGNTPRLVRQEKPFHLTRTYSIHELNYIEGKVYVHSFSGSGYKYVFKDSLRNASTLRFS